MSELEPWRRIWRLHAAPLISDAGLLLLHAMLKRNDVRVLQGATTDPPPMYCMHEWEAEAACPLAICGMAEGLHTVGDLSEWFANMCFEIDRSTGESASVRHFVNWADLEPRFSMVRQLLAEVELAMDSRGIMETQQCSDSLGPVIRKIG